MTDAGFVDIETEDRTIPLYETPEQTEQARANIVSLLGGFRNAALQARGHGFVKFESDLDHFILAVFEKEGTI